MSFRQRYHSGSTTFLQSFNCLPVELKTEVFSHHPPPVLHAGRQQRLDLAPLSYSQVCRQWRQIVFSNPRLWAVFDIQFWTSFSDCDVSMKHQERLLGVVHSWIQHSRAAPLTISLTADSASITSSLHPCLEAMLAFIGRENHRWRSIKFRLPEPGLRFLQGFLHQESTSIATQVHLESTGHGVTAGEPIGMPVTARFPTNLSSLHLQSTCYIVTLDDLLSLLEHSGRSLQSLDVHQVIDQLSNSRNVTCTALKSLRLSLLPPTTAGDNSFAAFLECISSSASLEDLQITCQYSRSVIEQVSTDYQDFRGALARWGVSLRTLRIQSLPMHSKSFLVILKTLHSLRHLRLGLQGMLVTDVILETLTLPLGESQTSGHCPQLETLTICSQADITAPVLIRCLDSRVQAGQGSLKRFVLNPGLEAMQGRGMTYSRWNEFRKWEDLGVTVKLSGE